MKISVTYLSELLTDVSCAGSTTYLDDPALDVGFAAVEQDELGIPMFGLDVPRVPVALFERRQAVRVSDRHGKTTEVWTHLAVRHDMPCIRHGAVQQLPSLRNWLIAERSRGQRGLQLQMPNGGLFAYADLPLDPVWVAAARLYGWVLVLHGPAVGVRIPPDGPGLAGDDAVDPVTARGQGLVTGGLVRWGRVESPQRDIGAIDP